MKRRVEASSPDHLYTDSHIMFPSTKFQAEWHAIQTNDACFFTRETRPKPIQELYEQCEKMPAFDKLQPYRYLHASQIGCVNIWTNGRRRPDARMMQHFRDNFALLLNFHFNAGMIRQDARRSASSCTLTRSSSFGSGRPNFWKSTRKQGERPWPCPQFAESVESWPIKFVIGRREGINVSRRRRCERRRVVIGGIKRFS